MTYKELDQHLLETLDNEVADMRQVSWKDLEKLHMVASVLTILWHPAMKSRMNHTVTEVTEHGSYLKEAEVTKPVHHFYQ